MARLDWCDPCGKPIHLTWKAATAAVGRLVAQHPDRRGLHPYRCPEGPGYHLTTQRTSRRNKTRKTERRRRKPDPREWNRRGH